MTAAKTTPDAVLRTISKRAAHEHCFATEHRAVTSWALQTTAESGHHRSIVDPQESCNDAVMCGPEESSDRQGGVETACMVQGGICPLTARVLEAVVVCRKEWRRVVGVL